MNLLKKRILAFIVDYILIVTYAVLLFLITDIVLPNLKFTTGNYAYSPIKAQLLGFFSLTLPVFLYSYLTESSNKKATLGKRTQKLKVKTNMKDRKDAILKRNILKYLPWEVAHTGVHWLFYYSSLSLAAPSWVWVLLGLPPLAVVAYFLSLFYTKGNQTLYDLSSQTRIRYSPV